jgi:hypothetical protein
MPLKLSGGFRTPFIASSAHTRLAATLTEEDIKLDQSRIIPGTEEQVDPSLLDRWGRYFPRK